MMRKTLLILITVLLVLPFAVFATAEKEVSADKVVIYASVDEANAKLILDAFTADTGITASFVHLSSGPALARITADYRNV